MMCIRLQQIGDGATNVEMEENGGRISVHSTPDALGQAVLLETIVVHGEVAGRGGGSANPHANVGSSGPSSLVR